MNSSDESDVKVVVRGRYFLPLEPVFKPPEESLLTAGVSARDPGMDFFTTGESDLDPVCGDGNSNLFFFPVSDPVPLYGT